MNPTLFNDSVDFNINFVINKNYLKYKDAPKQLDMNGEIKLDKLKSKIGMGLKSYNYGYYWDRSFLIFYNYKLISKSSFKINTAFSLGLHNLKINNEKLNAANDPFSTDITINKEIISNFNFGIQLIYNKHKFSAAYLNLFKENYISNSYGNSVYIKLGNLITNYSYNFKINQSLAFTPEIIYIDDFEESIIYFSPLLRYKNKIDIGAYYNTKSGKGLIISGTIFKSISLRYGFELLKRNETFARSSHSLSFSINFGPTANRR